MKTNNDTPAHLRHQTQFSRTGALDMSNRKPYRTKANKVRARKAAKRGDDGAFHCPLVPVNFHPPAKQ